jgi:hypothetical protein
MFIITGVAGGLGASGGEHAAAIAGRRRGKARSKNAKHTDYETGTHYDFRTGRM